MEDFKIKKKHKPFEQKIVEKSNTYLTIMKFSILSISILFLGILFIFFNEKKSQHTLSIQFPIHFYFSTLSIIGSSIALILTLKFFKQNNLSAYKNALLSTFFLGVLFSGLQISGCYEIFNTLKFQQNQMPQYVFFVYILSGLHILHLMAGLIFFAIFTFNAIDRLEDFSTSLFYFTDPIVKGKLSVFSLYWHFIGLLWIFLFGMLFVLK